MAENLASELQNMLAERRSAQFVLDDHSSRATAWTEWHRRIAAVDAIYRGEFHVVFPDEHVANELPKVANVVQLAVNDRYAMASQTPFTLRVDATREENERRANLRERIAANYMLVNRAALLRMRTMMDLDICGVNFKAVLPNFDTMFPAVRRFDPRFCFPDRLFSPDSPLTSLIVATETPYGQLVADYPQAGALGAQAKRVLGQPLDAARLVRVLEFYDGSECIKVAYIGSGARSFCVELMRLSNRLGRIPVTAAVLPTPDGQPRGIYDQALAPLIAKNRNFNLLVDAVAEWLSSPMVYHDIRNPEDYGSGAALESLSPSGFARRMPPDQPAPAVFNAIGGLEDEARSAAVYPQGRSGQLDASVISAAGVNALQGNLSASIAATVTVEAASWEDTLALCFATDETYLETGEAKQIAGRFEGVAFSDSYRPSRDIKGNHRIRVAAPTAGTDPFSKEVRVIQQVGAGLLDRRSAREHLTTVEDAEKVERRVLEEALQQAALSFAQTAAANGDPTPMARIAQGLKDGEDPLLLFSQFAIADASAAAAGAAAAPATGLEAFSEAAGLARGGLPSQPGALNVPGVGAAPTLPPLGDLRIA